MLPLLYSQTEKELAVEDNNSSTATSNHLFNAEVFNEVVADMQHEHAMAVEAERTRRGLIMADRKQREREKTERKLMAAEEKQMHKYLEDFRIACKPIAIAV